MDRTAWTDERLDDLREEGLELRREMRAEFIELRRDLAQVKPFMLGGLVAIIGTILPLYFR
jgi:hypothetical protein